MSPIKRSKILIAALVAAGFSAPAGASGPGTWGADFLQIPVGPRQAAMGDQGAALSDDAYGAYYNPATLSRLTRREVGFMYNQWAEGVNQQYVTYAHPGVGGGTLAGGINRLQVETFPGYTASGAPAASVGAQDIAPFVAYGRHVWGERGDDGLGISAGASAAYISEKLETESSSGFAAGIGALGHMPYRGFTLQAGLSARNLGVAPAYYGHRPPLPETYSLGVSAATQKWGAPFTLGVEARRTLDLSPSVSVGAEYWVHPVLALRLGYKSADDLGPGVRAGVGVRVRDVQVDYAMGIMGTFGWTHRIGLTYRFTERAAH